MIKMIKNYNIIKNFKNLNKYDSTIADYHTNNSLKNNDKKNSIKKFKYLHFKYTNFNEKSFINSITENFKLNTTYSLLIKISCDNNTIFKMTGVQIGLIIENVHNIEYYKGRYSVILKRIESTFDDYNNIKKIDTIEIVYFIVKTLPELVLKNVSNLRIPNKLVAKEEVKKNFNNNFLALTIDTKYYGESISYRCFNKYIDFINSNNNIIPNKIYNNLNINDINKMFIYNSPNNNSKFIIVQKNISENTFLINIYDYNTGLLIKEIKDTIISNNNNNVIFTRKIRGVTLEIMDKVKVNKIEINNKLISIKPLKPILEKKIDRNINFGSFDLETFIDSDGIAKVYALGFLTNIDKQPKLFYITDLFNDKNNNINDFDLFSYKLILKCIDFILSNRKYNNYIFYTHNFGAYDVIFLYDNLLKANFDKKYDYYILNTILRDDRIIKLEIKIKINEGEKIKYNKITFVDSLNLLNNSLSNLAESFNVETKKGYFPYDFVNRQTLNYIGKKPDKFYYKKISDIEYNKIENYNWNLKEKSLEYLSDDLNSLLQIMNKFSSRLYINFNTQMTNALTITRLALNIFLNDFYDIKEIPSINKLYLFNFIKEAYFGGMTEVYIPYGKDLVYLDVNSLYPFSALNPLPGTDCKYIESYEDQGLELDSLFGFFYAEIETNNQYLGLLPVHDNDKLIFPNGIYSGIWSTEELKFAKDNGYKIKVIKGYNFNKVEDIFNKYVLELYKVKSNSTGEIKMLAKSLLNNLLGRFGLNIIKPITKNIDLDELDNIASIREIHSIKNLTNNKAFITYSPLVSKKICEEHGIDYVKALEKESKLKIEKSLDIYNYVSISTAAMINSYARIFMNKIKLLILKNGGKFYYSDTDSLVIDKNSLNILSSLIGKELGQFKIEHFIKEAYFISNKTYCLVTDNNKIIIKSKGSINTELTLNNFKDMYFNQKNISTKRNNTKTLYDKASVILGTKNIILNHDSYTKREKIFNNNNLWIDTKPLSYYN
jgi:hypothetical protein